MQDAILYPGEVGAMRSLLKLQISRKRRKKVPDKEAALSFCFVPVQLSFSRNSGLSFPQL